MKAAKAGENNQPAAAYISRNSGGKYQRDEAK
jgi:hypothetical protein